MGWLSNDAVFDAFGQRAILRTYYEGADFGECLTTMQRIGQGTFDDWHKEWIATADRLVGIGDSCLEKKHQVSAREAYLRATTYYHTSYFPLFGKPLDPRLLAAFERETEAFHKAASLVSPPIEILEIPFEKSTLPAYFIKVDNSGKPRPTVVHTNGYDSNIQEMYFYHALAATRRGYNCLLFDGPGQGRNLIRDAIPMRHDWENVVSPIIDYALSKPEIDPKKIVLVGWSFGGFLAPRAAAFEHRIAALIADPGQWDMRDSILNAFPFSPEEKHDPLKFKSIEDKLRSDAMLRWKFIQRGFWVHGVDSLDDYLREMLKYEVSSVADQISCPTLITHSEGDPTAKGAPKLYEALRVQKKLMSFSLAEENGGHCETMARSLYHQRVFDWLDEIL